MKSRPAAAPNLPVSLTAGILVRIRNQDELKSDFHFILHPNGAGEGAHRSNPKQGLLEANPAPYLHPAWIPFQLAANDERAGGPAKSQMTAQGKIASVNFHLPGVEPDQRVPEAMQNLLALHHPPDFRALVLSQIGIHNLEPRGLEAESNPVSLGLGRIERNPSRSNRRNNQVPVAKTAQQPGSIQMNGEPALLGVHQVASTLISRVRTG